MARVCATVITAVPAAPARSPRPIRPTGVTSLSWVPIPNAMHRGWGRPRPTANPGRPHARRVRGRSLPLLRRDRSQARALGILPLGPAFEICGAELAVGDHGLLGGHPARLRRRAARLVPSLSLVHLATKVGMAEGPRMRRASRAAGRSGLEEDEALDVVGLGEEVEWLGEAHVISAVHQTAEVTGEGGRIAAHVGDPPGTKREQ